MGFGPRLVYKGKREGTGVRNVEICRTKKVELRGMATYNEDIRHCRERCYVDT